MTTSADRTHYGRVIFAVVLAYLLAFQSFLVTTASATEPGAKTFGILCAHKGSGPDHQRHQTPPCCATAACCVGIAVVGAGTAPHALTRRIAAPLRHRLAAGFAGHGGTAHRGFEARGPPQTV